MQHNNELDNMIQKTVRETLFQIGIIVDDSDNVVEFRKDMMHLRKWRNAVESIEKRSTAATVSFLIAALFAAIWMGIQALFHINTIPHSP